MRIVLIYQTEDGDEVAYETAEFHKGHATEQELAEFATAKYNSMKQHAATPKVYPRFNEVRLVEIFTKVRLIPV